MNKKIIKIVYSLVIFCILTISLTGCSKNEDDKTLKDKLNNEISYLDTKLIAMLNKANGISFENYIVNAEQISDQSTNSGTKASISSKSQEGSNSSSGSEGGSDSSSSSAGGNSEGSGDSKTLGGSGNSSNSGGQANTQNVKYKMVGNEILLQDRTPDWNGTKADIEKLYASWSTIVLDLYKVNVNNQDILNFNADLDGATQAIKSEDKAKTLNSLSKLYSYIPKYASTASNNAKANNIYKTKSNILNAYAAIEQDNFIESKKQLADAEQSFMPIINDINSEKDNQASINKAYILIKELQHSNDNKDKDIFYIKYKNLLQELNNII